MPCPPLPTLVVADPRYRDKVTFVNIYCVYHHSRTRGRVTRLRRPDAPRGAQPRWKAPVRVLAKPLEIVFQRFFECVCGCHPVSWVSRSALYPFADTTPPRSVSGSKLTCRAGHRPYPVEGLQLSRALVVLAAG